MTAPSSLDASIADLSAQLRAGDLTARQLAEESLARIEARDGALAAFLRTTPDRSLAAADAADAAIKAGTAGSLAGVPMAIKDVLVVEGIETTAGSKILAGFEPPYTATTVQRALDAGALPMGKTNCDEFAMGSSTENSAYGVVHNPWDLDRVPGGSSGGSAVAVAAGETTFALGSDTGGSIRQPAALSGCVGLKPTYGRTSRYGLIAFASSLDHVGTFTRTVGDAATVLEAIGGHDPMDSTSSSRPMDGVAAGIGEGVGGLRLGVPRDYFVEGMEPGVEAAVQAALRPAAGGGGGAGGRQPAPHRLRRGHLLHHRPGRGLLQPGAHGWGALRALRAWTPGPSPSSTSTPAPRASGRRSNAAS